MQWGEEDIHTKTGLSNLSIKDVCEILQATMVFMFEQCLPNKLTDLNFVYDKEKSTQDECPRGSNFYNI